MTDPTDTRDTGPRAGTPLWGYLAGITVIGFTALVVAMLRLDAAGLAGLARTPLFWMLAVLVILGELRPVMVSS
ncbi:GGDEF-domain containing protein, partial [Nonomuraea sp. NPDC004297]